MQPPTSRVHILVQHAAPAMVGEYYRLQASGAHSLARRSVMAPAQVSLDAAGEDVHGSAVLRFRPKSALPADSALGDVQFFVLEGGQPVQLGSDEVGAAAVQCSAAHRGSRRSLRADEGRRRHCVARRSASRRAGNVPSTRPPNALPPRAQRRVDVFARFLEAAHRTVRGDGAGACADVPPLAAWLNRPPVRAAAGGGVRLRP